MPILEARPATVFDVRHIAENMRDIDKQELMAMSDLSPLSVAVESFNASEKATVGTADGVPFCICGVVRKSMFTREGKIWMLGTKEIERYSVGFLRNCRQEMLNTLNNIIFVDNWCYYENKITLRWLKWLGFTINKPVPKGKGGELFCYFYKWI